VAEVLSKTPLPASGLDPVGAVIWGKAPPTAIPRGWLERSTASSLAHAAEAMVNKARNKYLVIWKQPAFRRAENQPELLAADLTNSVFSLVALAYGNRSLTAYCCIDVGIALDLSAGLDGADRVRGFIVLTYSDCSLATDGGIDICIAFNLNPSGRLGDRESGSSRKNTGKNDFAHSHTP
jgi:hypothetical protein